MSKIITTRTYFILMAIAYTLFAFYFLKGSTSKSLLLSAFALTIIAMILMAIKGDASIEATAG